DVKPAEPEPEQKQAALPPEPAPDIKPPDIVPPPEPTPVVTPPPEPPPIPTIETEAPKPAEPTPDVKTADARPRQKPKPPAPKTKTTQVDKLAALLNKLPTKDQADQGEQTAPTDQETVKGVGAQTALTMTEL